MELAPGALVRCVHRNDIGRPGQSPCVADGPVVGGIYTVKHVWPRWDYAVDNGFDGVELCEFQQPEPDCGEPPSWDHDIFVPIRKPPIPVEILALQREAEDAAPARISESV